MKYGLGWQVVDGFNGMLDLCDWMMIGVGLSYQKGVVGGVMMVVFVVENLFVYSYFVL